MKVSTLSQSTVVNHADIRDYIALLKPGVMSLVVFTGLIGMLVAPSLPHPFVALVAVGCIALGTGAAGAFNMVWEARTDALMQRTKNRPIPAGRISPENGLDFALITGFASVFIMAFAVNYLAAFLLLIAILFYGGIYTVWLKPRTPQNIVIGGAAGAFPPLIGWAAATGEISAMSLALFLVTFLWTPPHFWALALFSCKDYAKAGIPMLPVVAGEDETKFQIVRYSYALAFAAFLPVMLGAGWLFALATLALNFRFIHLARRVQKSAQEKEAKHLFAFSILYLFLIYIALLLDHVLLG